MILLDTDVLIELFKLNFKVADEVKKIWEKNVCISKISVLEMYIGALNKKKLQIKKKFFDHFSQIAISDKILDKTVILVHDYCLSHTLYINDAIIASTALSFNISLFTYNKKDFKFIPDLQIIMLKLYKALFLNLKPIINHPMKKIYFLFFIFNFQLVLAPASSWHEWDNRSSGV